MSGIDRAGARWAFDMGRHPCRCANPFIEDTPHHAAFEAGRNGFEFPAHLIVEAST